MILVIFFFQAEDGIRDLVRSRGLGDVYKRQLSVSASFDIFDLGIVFIKPGLAKENINYIPYYLKPWKTGLFGK